MERLATTLAAPSAAPTGDQPNSDLACVLSPSQVAKWTGGCQVAWWYEYGLGLKSHQTAPLALGRAVHAATADALKNKIEIGRDMPPEAACETFDTEWKREADVTKWGKKDNPADLHAIGRQVTRMYVRDLAPKLHPAAVEIDVAGVVGGVSVRGRLDVIEDEEHGCTIRDTKVLAKTQAGWTHGNEMQLATYAAALREDLPPGLQPRGAIDALVRTKTPDLISIPGPISARSMQLVETIYPAVQAQMRAGVYVPNRSNYKCSRTACAHWQRCEDEFGGRVRG